MDLYKRLRKQILFQDTSRNSGGVLLGELDRISVGKYLLSNAIDELKKNGFVSIDLILKHLRESSCLGNHQSSFIISVIYLHGIGIKANSLLSSFYLMRAVLDSDRMSLLALGHKHSLGLDGVPVDYDQAFCNQT
jgi:TPR repeat protein